MHKVVHDDKPENPHIAQLERSKELRRHQKKYIVLHIAIERSNQIDDPLDSPGSIRLDEFENFLHNVWRLSDLARFLALFVPYNQNLVLDSQVCTCASVTALLYSSRNVIFADDYSVDHALSMSNVRMHVEPNGIQFGRKCEIL